MPTSKTGFHRSGLALLIGLIAAPQPVGTQQPRQPEPVLSAVVVPVPAGEARRTLPADSARALSVARSAQSRFELIRRNNLPWAWDQGRGPCDEVIGRFCLWHGPKDSHWQPPPDPEPTVAARATLIARLDTAAAVIPGDWWVAGQRVRYLVEAERTDDAIAAASDCRSDEPGWCDALLGYALHLHGDYVRAHSAFDEALAAMAPRERERWTDLSLLLEPGEVRAYRRLGEAERAEFEARFWWLADPLFMLPGNDRRTEHFSRHVLDRLQNRARQTEGTAWGGDLREILVRYGSPAGWERVRPRAPTLETGASIITRYPSGRRHFDPALDHVRDPLRIPIDGWDLDTRRARTGYAPAYASPIEPPEFQLATFQRGDSVVVVSALRLPADSLGVRHPAEFALTLALDERTAPWRVRRDDGDTVAFLASTVPAAPKLVSVEALAREAKRAARVRYALDLRPLPAHGLAVSDLLLLGAADDLPDSLAAAIPRMRPSTAARSGERLGVFWEIYGLAESDLPLGTSVRLIDENAGLLRRLAQRARLLQPQTPLQVNWEETPAGGRAVLARSLAVELPELGPGTYTLEVTLTARGREPLATRRTITVAGDAGEP